MDLGLRRVVEGQTAMLPAPPEARSAGQTRTPTVVIHRVHVRLAADQLGHHPLHGQASGQDQRRRAVIHPGVEVGHSVADQNLPEEKGRRGGHLGERARRSQEGKRGPHGRGDAVSSWGNDEKCLVIFVPELLPRSSDKRLLSE